MIIRDEAGMFLLQLAPFFPVSLTQQLLRLWPYGNLLLFVLSWASGAYIWRAIPWRLFKHSDTRILVGVGIAT